jgi:hypothetical protein
MEWRLPSLHTESLKSACKQCGVFFGLGTFTASSQAQHGLDFAVSSVGVGRLPDGHEALCMRVKSMCSSWHASALLPCCSYTITV